MYKYGKCTVAAVHHNLLVATIREMHGEILHRYILLAYSWTGEILFKDFGI